MRFSSPSNINEPGYEGNLVALLPVLFASAECSGCDPKTQTERETCSADYLVYKSVELKVRFIFPPPDGATGARNVSRDLH
jgi:hypothetical protein